MMPRVDSFGRSRFGLEFNRSPLLERNDPDAVGGELAATRTHNFIFGFAKWVDPDWFWYPFLRATWTYDAEVRADTYNLTYIGLLQGVAYATNQSAGFTSGLAGYGRISVAIVDRQAERLVMHVGYRNAAQETKVVVFTLLVQGTPIDIRPIVDDFWETCDAAPNPEPPPLQAGSPVLLEINQRVNDQLIIEETSRGLRPFVNQGFIDAQIAQSTMAINTGTAGLLYAFVGPLVDLIETIAFRGEFGPHSLDLNYVRHVRHFNPRGEAQLGELDLGDRTVVPTVLLCQRGFTAEYEFIIPTVLTAARLDAINLKLNGGTGVTIERRIIPPNPAVSLLTC